MEARREWLPRLRRIAEQELPVQEAMAWTKQQQAAAHFAFWQRQPADWQAEHMYYWQLICELYREARGYLIEAIYYKGVLARTASAD